MGARMDDEAIDAVLTQTWDDRRLSRGERRALEQLVGDARRPDDERHRFRRRAFELAGGFADAAPAREVLGWLEDVVKALWPASAAPVAASEALFSPRDDVAARLAAMFDGARRRVDVCVFTITDDRVVRAMLRAHERGVKIRVLSDDDKAQDRGSDVARLAARGLAVRVDRCEHHMHHKFAIFDGERLVNGSYNWTRSANDHNVENLVVTGDPDLVRDFGAEFEALWAAAERYR